MKTFTKKRILSLLMASALVGACAKKNDDGASADSSPGETESAVEAGLTVVSGMMDEQANASLALSSERVRNSPWALLLPEAFAANCSRAVANTCSSGVRSALYDDCAVAGTLRTLNGQVDLTYSQAACTLASNGDSVTRVYNVTVNGPRGGSYTLSSHSATDYTGATYGGGGVLTKTSAGWNVQILGRHSSFTLGGRERMSVSVRTLSDLQVTGGISRASRTVSGGQLQVNHNRAGFTAVFAPSNLQWSSSCCHPTSGQLAVTYSGSKTGSATVTFNGCGSASLSESGQTTSLALSYCE